MTPGAPAPRPRASAASVSRAVELWGGIECTVNRVGDRYFDQIALTRHADRIVEDLTRFADLGIRTLRYPVLWESTAPGSIGDADWSSSDVALSTMRRLGIRPIIGFVHHGSGPRHTNLLDPEFVRKLAAYADAVARRYSWVTLYTPINEPLTTARFATLYGHWYPHTRDDHSFARAMVNQCAAIRESMAAVRAINPDALLVQTEDLGKTYSTPSIAYQATFDNNRRWLTFDLLGGRIDEWHPLWWYLLESGITRQELESFLTTPCVPGILGINHYLTSDRYLDDQVELYAESARGGNGRHAYADVEAVRVLDDRLIGHRGVLREAWDRYAIPLALTEVHLGCTRDEQLRWLGEAWSAAHMLRQDDVDIRAITVWSLLGSYGWSSLLVSGFDAYEPGAFDLRSPRPRTTALAQMTRALAIEGSYDHPVLDCPGWWRRSTRLLPAHRADSAISDEYREEAHNEQRVILITGGRGTLGRAFQRIAMDRGLAYCALGRDQLDICNPGAIARALEKFKPWAVVNAAGYVRVDDAERDAERCYSLNTAGVRLLAEECLRRGIPLATFSSDLVFDGKKVSPYLESDPISPLNIYGASKAKLEEQVAGLENSLLIRTSAFFGPWDSFNFLATTFNEIARGHKVNVANDAVISPTYVPDLVNTTLDLLIDGERGVWHLANDGALSWYEFATLAAQRANLDSRLIVGRPTEELHLPARRPLNSALDSERGRLMPPLDHAITRWLTAVASRRPQTKVMESNSSV